MEEGWKNGELSRMLYEAVSKPGGFLDLGPIPPLPPLTWNQRLREYRNRLSLAWRVLRGDDIHEHCD